ncbi:MAG: TetR/AcrR family transcriptional regulator [Verrucomicrobiota bacterium]
MTKGRCNGKRRPQATRRRILEAGGRLFAAHGFHGVGFRDIAALAHVSLRMPNHHFGTKERLYAECVRYALIDRLDFPAIFGDAPVLADARAARDQIAEKIRACFFAVHPPSGESSWCGEILGRALTENLDGALEGFQEGLKPAREWFHAAIRHLRPHLTQTEFVLWYGSLWAQVSFFATARPAILARLGKKRYDVAFMLTAANHLVHVMLQQLETRG